jgi:hypothetical protein
MSTDLAAPPAASEPPHDPGTEAIRATEAPGPCIVIGTPHAAWASLAVPVRARLAAAGRAAAAPADDAGAADPASALSREPGARALVFVDSPARALAHCLAHAAPPAARAGAMGLGAEVDDVAGALAAWREGARRLLQLVYREPERCLFVDAAEAAADRAAFWRTLAGWDAAFATDAPEAAPPPATDPVLDALAAGAAAADLGAQRLYEELQAACVTLGDAAGSDALIAPALSVMPALAGGPAIAAPATEAALQSYRRLLARAADRDALAERERTAQAGLARMQARLDEATTAAGAAARAAAEAAEQAAAAHASQLALLEAQLAQAEAARDAAEQAAARAATEAEREQHALREQLRQAGQAQLQSVADLEAARKDGELLLAQLHAVQEELETYFLEKQEGETRLAEASAGSAEQRRRLQETEVKLEKVTAERDDLAKRVSALAPALAKAEAGRREAEGLLAAAREAASHAAVASDQERAALRLRLRHLEQSNEEMQQEQGLAAQREQGLRTELDEARAEHARQAAQLQALAQAEKGRGELEGLLTAAREAAAQAAAAADRERVALLLRLEHLEQSNEEAQQERDLAAQREQQLRTELDEARADHERDAAQLQLLRQECDLLLSQLHTVQQQLETQFLQSREQANRASEAAEQFAQSEQRLATERATAEHARAALQQQLAQALAGAERNQERSAAHERQRAAELARVQEALHRHKDLARREARPPALEAGEFVPSAQRTEPPYRELTFTLRDLRLFDHAIDALDARLVEHHGHPGLVLLDGPAPGAGLGAWAESGQDRGRPYMLLVPSDAPARRALALLGTHDWLLVRGIVAAAEEALAGAADSGTTLWRQVARRLLAELDDLPPRLRYDRLEVEPEGDVQGASLVYRVRFGHLLHGTRYRDALSLRWRPGVPQAGEAPISLLGPADAGEAPALAGWPPGESGGWATEWPLPLGAGLDAAERRSRWRALPASDQALVLALLDALPAAADLLAAEGRLPAGADRDAWITALRRWQAEAAQIDAPSHALLRVARRLRRRALRAAG